MRALLTVLATGLVSLAQAQNAQLPAVQIPEGQAHIVGAAKLIVGDAAQHRAYYESVLGMKQVGYYSAKGVYDEPIMGFDSGARLALFQPLAEKALPKSQYPVVLVYTPDLEGAVKRLDAGKHEYRRLPAAQAGTFRIAIAKDPSGNAVEILERTGKPIEVGGSKLIVDDRAKAEAFYAKVLNAKPGQRYVTAAYDEVIMTLGSGPFLALFQPKNEAPLPKSQYPVVAIYTKELDTVLARIKEAGLGFREVKSSTPNSRIIIAKDPAGNAIELIHRP